MRDSRVVAQIFLGVGIVIAAVVGGLTLYKIKTLDQTVRVKGLAERIVKANEASWIIEFQASDTDIRKLNTKVADSRKAIEEFVLSQGFEANSIQRQPVSISQSSQYDGGRVGEFKAHGAINISSQDVDKVTKAAESTDSLLEKGVLMTRTSVNYYFTDLNSIKPEMLKEASQKAREAAAKFSEDSGVKVGMIKAADQGPFSITAPFSEWGSETTSIMKRVRVVTNVEYFLAR
jgi:hypothetical protein